MEIVCLQWMWTMNDAFANSISIYGRIACAIDVISRFVHRCRSFCIRKETGEWESEWKRWKKNCFWLIGFVCNWMQRNFNRKIILLISGFRLSNRVKINCSEHFIWTTFVCSGIHFTCEQDSIGIYFCLKFRLTQFNGRNQINHTQRKASLQWNKLLHFHTIFRSRNCINFFYSSYSLKLWKYPSRWLALCETTLKLHDYCKSKCSRNEMPTI